MIFLHVESLENKLFELDFSIFQKVCFYGQTPQEGKVFLHSYDIFFRDPCSFPYAKKLLKVSDHFVENICHMSQQP